MTLERKIVTIRGERRYCVVGQDGGVDFHVSEAPAGYEAVCPRTARLEIHRRAPADYQRGREADFATCWLLEAPCWCDGTTLYATEHLLPLFDLGLDAAFWLVLEVEYLNRFREAVNE